MKPVRPAPDHEALPPPTLPVARAAWEAANLTSVEIRRRHDPARFQAFRWRRDPRYRHALQLGVGSLVIPLVGPWAWRVANAELAAIRNGLVSPHGRRAIVVARACAIASTCGLVAGVIGAVTMLW